MTETKSPQDAELAVQPPVDDDGWVRLADESGALVQDEFGNQVLIEIAPLEASAADPMIRTLRFMGIWINRSFGRLCSRSMPSALEQGQRRCVAENPILPGDPPKAERERDASRRMYAP
jgi:hypothetical protein